MESTDSSLELAIDQLFRATFIETGCQDVEGRKLHGATESVPSAPQPVQVEMGTMALYDDVRHVDTASSMSVASQVNESGSLQAVGIDLYSSLA